MRCAEAYQDKTNLYLLLDIELGGEFWTLMARVGTFPVPWASFYIANTLSALAYFDSIGVCYRDLKPENLLIDRRGYIKICDLGFARQPNGGRCFTFCGTPEYMAPELIMSTPHNQAVDWWALGILLYEMLLGRSPFAPPDYFDPSLVREHVFVGIIRYSWRGAEAAPPLPWCCFDKHAASFIKLMMRVEPTERPRPLECMAHPFFAGTDFLDMERRRIPAPYVPVIEGDTDTSNFVDEFGDGEQAKPGRQSTMEQGGAIEQAPDSKALARSFGACAEAFETLVGFTPI